MAGSNPLYLSSSSCLRSSSLSFYSKTSVVSLRAFPKTPLRLTFPRIVAFSSNDIKVGSNVEVDGAPWRVLEFLHVKPGKGAAFVRTKMRNYVTGNTVEKTFRAGSTLTEANILKETKQYTYKDGSQYVFMDLSTYEESRLNDVDIGDKKNGSKRAWTAIYSFGMERFSNSLWMSKTTIKYVSKVYHQLFIGRHGTPGSILFGGLGAMVIDFELPITVKMTVVDVDPGLKGDTAQGGSKPATLDTGAVVNVPLFIGIGEEILVDTRTGQYMSRA